MRKTIMLATVAVVATTLAWGYGNAAVVTYKGTLSAAAEVPPVKSAGSGSASVNFDAATKEISYNVTYTGLSGPATAAHIHCGAAAGANSGVAVKFDKVASPITGSATLTDAQVADLTAGKCYVNVHTDANKGGEIRAQLMK
ncbi:MAG TPA: CHRD domain-containing protein [Stellaceae bacterium]|nr:CHRD domain-containing protein [Stellaceae bacterium]